MSTEETTASEPAPAKPGTDWAEFAAQVLDLCSALLLGVSTICMGYSAFQAGAWEGETLKKFNESQAAIATANDESMKAAQGGMLDASLLVKIVELNATDAGTLLTTYTDMLSPAGREVMGLPKLPDVPANDPSAKKYEDTLMEKANAKRKEGEKLFAEGNAADENGDSYELVGIVLTIATFFAGLAPIMRRLFMKIGLLGLGGFIWLIAVLWMLFLPSPG